MIGSWDTHASYLKFWKKFEYYNQKFQQKLKEFTENTIWRFRENHRVLEECFVFLLLCITLNDAQSTRFKFFSCFFGK